MNTLLEQAKSLGFDIAAPLDPKLLESRNDIRSMCASDKCNLYEKNWGCPPHCGSVAECQQRLRSYSRGILVQTVGHMQKTVDTKCYRETEQRHLHAFYALAELVRASHPDALCLGSGGCRVCKRCAYPEACRFPDKRVSSMEAYGLFVTQVCKDHAVPYHHGERTVTYTACILF